MIGRLYRVGGLCVLTVVLACRVASPGLTADPGARADRAQTRSAGADAVVAPDNRSPARPAASSQQLSELVMPTAYALDVDLNPDRSGYRGAITIDLRIASPVDVIWLHGAGLSIERATLNVVEPDHSGPSAAEEVSSAGRTAGTGEKRSGARAIPITSHVVQADRDLIGLELAHRAPAGAARLSIVFGGTLGTAVGLFRQRTGGRHYIFSDFEPTDARRAFPCFDEPRFKTPWTLSMIVPNSTVGLSNMPVRNVEPVGTKKKRIDFATTRPLPTYLVALAVGPFELVEARYPADRGSEQSAARHSDDRGAAPRVPIRIVVPMGEKARAQIAANMAPELLTRVTDYFATPVPFPKIDLISVPSFHGAMENPGLITVGAHILLADPARPSLPQQRLLAQVCAHEFAHLWFGDLVTPRDWNDLWLNEGFATWLSDKVLGEWDPARRQVIEKVMAKNQAMVVDGYPTARAVRQVGSTRRQLLRAFDPLSYQKGAALLAMFEAWLGQKVFRDAIRAYVASHVDGTATAEDFLAALSVAARRDVSGSFRPFLDAPGVPEVTAELSCSDAGIAVELGQKRHLVLSARSRSRPGDNETLWQIPLCLSYDAGAGKSVRQCALLAERWQRVELATDHCPAWLMPNHDAAGYFRYRLPVAQLAALARAPLSEPELADLVYNLRALLYSADLAANDALPIVAELARSRSRYTTEAIVELLTDVADHLIAPRHQDKFRALVNQLYSPRAQAFGFAKVASEAEDDTLLRPTLVGFVGRYGADQTVVARARRLARRWLRTGRGIERGMITATLQIAAAHGDAVLHGQMSDQFERAVRRGDRDRLYPLLGALAAFRQPQLIERSLALVKKAPDIEFRVYFFQELMANSSGRQRALDFLERSAPTLRGRNLLVLLAPLYTRPPCSRAEFATIASLVERVGNVRDTVQQAMERAGRQADTCAAFKSTQADSAQQYFRRNI
ncbi:MAG: M1 family metallopeptidase [Proteobacteria bacterium]|nr:M1 family metallopeptidase [Pseudomonadota bacterium]